VIKLELLKSLFYKTDKKTNRIRLSKLNTGSTLIFLIIYLIFFISYLSNSYYYSILDVIFFPLFIAILLIGPIYVIGLIISILIDEHYNNVSVIDNTNNTSHLNNFKDPAQKFKESIENNNSENAKVILNSWNNLDDANYRYARIIFEGMPPTNIPLVELEKNLKDADTIKTDNLNLREWYRKTAVKVINLNENETGNVTN